jgi:hypothetical protein
VSGSGQQMVSSRQRTWEDIPSSLVSLAVKLVTRLNTASSPLTVSVPLAVDDLRTTIRRDTGDLGVRVWHGTLRTHAGQVAHSSRGPTSLSADEHILIPVKVATDKYSTWHKHRL